MERIQRRVGESGSASNIGSGGDVVKMLVVLMITARVCVSKPARHVGRTCPTWLGIWIRAFVAAVASGHGAGAVGAYHLSRGVHVKFKRLKKTSLMRGAMRSESGVALRARIFPNQKNHKQNACEKLG